jgi:glycosyltransferase involved in cell wall biosynthesis
MTTATPEVLDLTVVMPAHNAAATIGEQLDALVGQVWSGSWEVVVVDNRSTDATAEIVARYSGTDPRIRLIRATERNGIGYTRNTGIDAARGRSIVMADSDDVVAPGWLAAIGDALCRAEFVTGPLDVKALNPPRVVETRGFAIEQGPGEFLGTFPFAHSCNMGFRRRVVDRVGRFDESLVNGSDVEYSYRLWRAGIELVYVPEAVVRYRYRTEIADLYRQARNYARAKATLVQRFRADGTDIRVPGSWRNWLWLVRNAPRLRTDAGRARWVWVLGGCVGSVQGAWRAR